MVEASSPAAVVVVRLDRSSAILSCSASSVAVSATPVGGTPSSFWNSFSDSVRSEVQSPSIGRIPRFPADPYDGPDRKTWFCLDNPDVASQLLGAPAPPREIVIAVDRYRAQRDLSDGFDTAELAEVIEVGPEASATLLEP